MIEEIKQFWVIFIKIYSHQSKEEITIRVLIPELVTRPSSVHTAENYIKGLHTRRWSSLGRPPK